MCLHDDSLPITAEHYKCCHIHLQQRTESPHCWTALVLIFFFLNICFESSSAFFFLFLFFKPPGGVVCVDKFCPSSVGVVLFYGCTLGCWDEQYWALCFHAVSRTRTHAKERRRNSHCFPVRHPSICIDTERTPCFSHKFCVSTWGVMASNSWRHMLVWVEGVTSALGGWCLGWQHGEKCNVFLHSFMF